MDMESMYIVAPKKATNKRNHENYNNIAVENPRSNLSYTSVEVDEELLNDFEEDSFSPFVQQLRRNDAMHQLIYNYNQRDDEIATPFVSLGSDGRVPVVCQECHQELQYSMEKAYSMAVSEIALLNKAAIQIDDAVEAAEAGHGHSNHYDDGGDDDSSIAELQSRIEVMNEQRKELQQRLQQVATETYSLRSHANTLHCDVSDTLEEDIADEYSGINSMLREIQLLKMGRTDAPRAREAEENADAIPSKKPTLPAYASFMYNIQLAPSASARVLNASGAGSTASTSLTASSSSSSARSRTFSPQPAHSAHLQQFQRVQRNSIGNGDDNATGAKPGAPPCAAPTPARQSLAGTPRLVPPTLRSATNSPRFPTPNAISRDNSATSAASALNSSSAADDTAGILHSSNRNRSASKASTASSSATAMLREIRLSTGIMHYYAHTIICCINGFRLVYCPVRYNIACLKYRKKRRSQLMRHGKVKKYLRNLQKAGYLLNNSAELGVGHEALCEEEAEAALYSYDQHYSSIGWEEINAAWGCLGGAVNAILHQYAPQLNTVSASAPPFHGAGSPSSAVAAAAAASASASASESTPGKPALSRDRSAGGKATPAGAGGVEDGWCVYAIRQSHNRILLCRTDQRAETLYVEGGRDRVNSSENGGTCATAAQFPSGNIGQIGQEIGSHENRTDSVGAGPVRFHVLSDFNAELDESVKDLRAESGIPGAGYCAALERQADEGGEGSLHDESLSGVGDDDDEEDLVMVDYGSGSDGVTEDDDEEEGELGYKYVTRASGVEDSLEGSGFVDVEDEGKYALPDPLGLKSVNATEWLERQKEFPLSSKEFEYNQYNRAVISLAMILVCFVLFIGHVDDRSLAAGSNNKAPRILFGYMREMYAEVIAYCREFHEAGCVSPMEKSMLESVTLETSSDPLHYKGKQLPEEVFLHIVDKFHSRVVLGVGNSSATSSSCNTKESHPRNRVTVGTNRVAGDAGSTSTVVVMRWLVSDICCTVSCMLRGDIERGAR